MILSGTVFAGINGTTVHSRANCINNESITWYLGHSFPWRVVSFHTPDYKHNSSYHYIDTGYINTWRQAAVHWGEGTTPSGYYLVVGFHYILERNHDWLFDNTQVDDCSIYDGWWDY
ncbi:hypothetical protein [Legionella bozemanae]|uniref:hypothetical protein n=1 Tax=Legionella bozemanae TaxID=447 RepID=UPI0010411F13|nr:hypothetical protein [Legionella bozemanae]